MKSIEKLQNAIWHLRGSIHGKENESVVSYVTSLLNEFIIDNESEPKTAKGNLWNCVYNEKDKAIRPNLTGIFHDAEHEMAVACDTRMLVATKADYNPEFAGKIVDKYGNEIKGQYPKWMSVIPNYEEGKRKTVTIDEGLCKKAIKHAKAFRKAEGYKGKMGNAVLRCENDTWLNAEYLLKAKGFCSELWVDDPSRAAYYKDDEKIVLIMPVYMGTDNDKEREAIKTASAVLIECGAHPLF